MTPIQMAAHLAQGFLLFRYCSYWRDWSQILSIEIDDGVAFYKERTLGEEHVREHCTSPCKADRFLSQLPKGVAEKLGAWALPHSECLRTIELCA